MLLAETVSLSDSEMAVILVVLALILLVPVAINIVGAVLGFRYGRTGGRGARAGWLTVIGLDAVVPLLSLLGGEASPPLFVLGGVAVALLLGMYGIGRAMRKGPPERRPDVG